MKQEVHAELTAPTNLAECLGDVIQAVARGLITDYIRRQRLARRLRHLDKSPIARPRAPRTLPAGDATSNELRLVQVFFMALLVFFTGLATHKYETYRPGAELAASIEAKQRLPGATSLRLAALRRIESDP